MDGEPENTVVSDGDGDGDGDCNGDDENSGVDETVEGCREQISTKTGGDDDKKEILRFTMLINKFNSDMDMKRNWRAKEESARYKRDVKCAMFFNKEVTIRSNSETPTPGPPPFLTIKSLEPNEVAESGSKQSPFIKANPFKALVQKLDSHPKQAAKGSSDASFLSATYSSSDVPARKNKNQKTSESSTLKKVSSKRSVTLESGPSPDLRVHYSLTSLSKNIKVGLRGVLKSKIPSLTAIETNGAATKTGGHKYGCWERWNSTTALATALATANEDVIEKRLNLQVSKSSNDNNNNNRRSLVKLRKEEPASVSDSKLLNADSNCKKHIKKYDKKSRGDSMKKEKDGGGIGNSGRKQVQWKTEVDVIYFSTHLAANGDRTGEVVGRVMEPLREEWEQQRKGFYSKFVPYHIESHLKDHFISLLKI